jgi:hypothetical protein
MHPDSGRLDEEVDHLALAAMREILALPKDISDQVSSVLAEMAVQASTI